MRDFLPPVHNTLVTSVVKRLIPFALRKEQLAVRPSVNCLNTLKSLRGKSCVLMVNHSDRFDPLVMFALSKYANEDFYYLAAREIFDQMYGLHGLFLQHCGAYSVIRGNPEDEASREKTIDLIVKGERKLVEFPEGDVSGRDDEVLPLKDDGIRNLISAQRLIRKLSSEKTVQIVPVAVYYQAHEDTLQALLDRTGLIEQALSIRRREIKQEGMAALHIRLAYVIEALVNAIEDRYGIKPSPGGQLNTRILKMAKQMVQMIAADFGIRTADIEAPSEAEMLYSLRSRVRQFCSESGQNWGTYSRKLRQELCDKSKEVQFELDRVQQLLILESTMREQPVNLDVAWRIVDRLEIEVLGKATPKGHRTAWIDAGSPIDLSTYVGQHDWNERIVQRLTDDIRNAIFFRLQRSKKEHTIAPPGEVVRSV